MNHERAAAAPAGLVCLCTVLLLMLPGGAPGDAQAAVGTPVRGREVVAQIPSPLSLEVNPVLNVPVFDSAPYFNLGGGAEIGLAYQIPRSVFYLSGGVGYAYEPDQAADSLSMVVARAGAGIRVPLGAGVSVRGFASAGYFFAAFNTLSTTGNNPYAAGGLSLQFNLNPMFRLGAGAQYQYYAGLFHGVSAMIFTGIALGNLGGSVEIPTLELRPTSPARRSAGRGRGRPREYGAPARPGRRRAPA